VSVSFDLSGRVAVVAGGAGGIGRAVASRLAGAGARVWIWDVVELRADAWASVVVDLMDADQVSLATKVVLDESRRIDILVNAAGYLGPHAPFETVSADEWRKVLAVNLEATVQTCRCVVPVMRAQGSGRIVNMGSLAGKQGLANLVAYSAASAGVIGFTKALAHELAPAGIDVNCVAPGPIDTRLITDLGPEIVADMIESSPMKRLGRPEEVADLVVWLSSGAATFQTGAIFDASGGRATY
jgi:NAD(P)-dependent dehydrogenase (short-subunit alcohol dehydrogenase family)